MIGVSVFQIDMGKWHSEKLEMMLTKAITGKNGFSDFKVEYESITAGKRNMLLNAQKLYGVGNRNEMLLLAMEDVTERKAVEQQRNDFVGIVSHELKTPVTSLKPFGQVLQLRLGRNKDNKSVEMLRKMDAQINNLTLLINDLLDATRIEGGKLQFNEEMFSVDDVISEVVEEVQRTAPKHQIIVTGEPSNHIKGDRYRIGQVLTNPADKCHQVFPGGQPGGGEHADG